MSQIDDQDDWSSDSASLFREARRAHDPTPAESARLTAVLERIQAQKATVSPASKGAADRVAPAVSRQLLRQVASVSLGTVCIAAVSYAYIHFSRQPAEPPRNDKPAPAAIVSAPTPGPLPPSAAARNEAEASAQMGAAHEEAQSRPRSQRRRTHGATEKRQMGRIEPASTSGAANSAPSDQAATRAAPQNRAAAPDHLEPMSPGKAVARSPGANASEPDPEHTEAAVADKPATPPPAAPTELALMKRMQGALREADYSRVLTLCEEHARRWPHGVFELEREGVRAIAACGENTDDAVQRAKRFLVAHPQAPVALRVSAACAAQLAKR